MSGFRRFEVAPEAVAEAQKLGLFGNVEKRLARMARHSAPFTHQAGNRRFESYVLRIEGGRVVSIKQLDLVSGGVVTDVMGRLGRQARVLDAIERHLDHPSPDHPGPAAEGKGARVPPRPMRGRSHRR